MDPHDHHVLLDTDGAAELLLVSRRTVQNWTREGIIPSVKLGRRRMYLRNALEQHLQSLSDASLDGTTLSPVTPHWEADRFAS